MRKVVRTHPFLPYFSSSSVVSSSCRHQKRNKMLFTRVRLPCRTWDSSKAELILTCTYTSDLLFISVWGITSFSKVVISLPPGAELSHKDRRALTSLGRSPEVVVSVNHSTNSLPQDSGRPAKALRNKENYEWKWKKPMKRSIQSLVVILALKKLRRNILMLTYLILCVVKPLPRTRIFCRVRATVQDEGNKEAPKVIKI